MIMLRLAQDGVQKDLSYIESILTPEQLFSSGVANFLPHAHPTASVR